MPSTILKT